jgi:hypothetical protein
MSPSSEPSSCTTERILEVFEGSTVVTTTVPKCMLKQRNQRLHQLLQPVRWLSGSHQRSATRTNSIMAYIKSALQRKAYTEVWDNRDGLTVNPKRPWFKAVEGDAQDSGNHEQSDNSQWLLTMRSVGQN